MLCYNDIYCSIESEEKKHMNKIIQEIVTSNRHNAKWELKNRRDVINKTIMRAVRRYFIKEFRGYFPHKRFRNYRRKLKHLDLILKEYSCLYRWTLQSSELYLLFGYLLESKHFSNITKACMAGHIMEIKQFCLMFNKCWVSYSHSAFESIIKSKYFKTLFLIFEENYSEMFLKIHEDSTHNSQEYIEAMGELEARLA